MWFYTGCRSFIRVSPGQMFKYREKHVLNRWIFPHQLKIVKQLMPQFLSGCGR